MAETKCYRCQLNNGGGQKLSACRNAECLIHCACRFCSNVHSGGVKQRQMKEGSVCRTLSPRCRPVGQSAPRSGAHSSAKRIPTQSVRSRLLCVSPPMCRKVINPNFVGRPTAVYQFQLKLAPRRVKLLLYAQIRGSFPQSPLQWR